jgi:hypothetical protein
MEKETLEEAFECFKKEYPILKNYNLHHLLQVARFGVKWQQEQDKNKYSEKEVIELLNKREDFINQTSSIFDYTSAKEWFEQNKKK